MKDKIIDEIRNHLRAALRRLTQSAMDAHAAATDPGSKAESKYDTRSLEESYLASGQAQQVKELAATLKLFEKLEAKPFSPSEQIDAGALVEVQNQNTQEYLWFFLAPASGGLNVTIDGKEITLLSPESPLFQKLCGLETGETLNQPPFTIKSVS